MQCIELAEMTVLSMSVTKLLDIIDRLYLANERNNNIFNIPQERRKLRPNVEAVIKELKEKTRASKL